MQTTILFLYKFIIIAEHVDSFVSWAVTERMLR